MDFFSINHGLIEFLCRQFAKISVYTYYFLLSGDRLLNYAVFTVTFSVIKAVVSIADYQFIICKICSGTHTNSNCNFYFLIIKFNNIVEFDNQKIKVTVTVGMCTGTNLTDYELVIRNADDRLYYGKRNGKNCVVK